MKSRKEIQSQTVAKNANVQAHLEAIKGSKIDLPGGIIASKPNLIYLLGATVQMVGPGYPTSVITWKNLVIPQATHESLAPSLDMTGVSTTDSNGKSVFGVAALLPYKIQHLAEPVTIVATPHGSVPSFLTAEHTFVVDPSTSQVSDLEITVQAWDPNGSPSPDVTFDWRCRFQGFMIELIW